MKKIILLTILWIIQGCTLSSGKSNPASATECPNKPSDSLQQDAIETAYLSQGTVKKSGQVSQGRPRGYSFEGKAGQSIGHSTNDNVCIWVYAPDNTVVTNNAINLDGVHIVQVSTLQGSTSYTLNLSLNDPRNNAEDVEEPKTDEEKAPPSDEKDEKKETPTQRAKAECGSGEPTKSERRYRVLARGQQILDVIISEHCMDAFTRPEDGWIQVASFNSEKGAKSFIEEKRSQIGGTWKTESFWFDK